MPRYCWSPRTDASRGARRCARWAGRLARIAHQHATCASCSRSTATRSSGRRSLPAIGDLPNVTMTEPLPYGGFARLMNRATLILTDSGGVQEEGPSLGKPVLVMRDTTERPEAVARRRPCAWSAPTRDLIVDRR